jgi:hypothetical protein
MRFIALVDIHLGGPFNARRFARTRELKIHTRISGAYLSAEFVFRGKRRRQPGRLVRVER